MKELLLFTDGSVNTQSKIGYGAYLSISEMELPVEAFKNQVKVKRFEKTNSTKLELQTLLWALIELQASDNKIIIHTDSQNIISLLKRRERLELNNYSTKKNKLITNHIYYKEFYKIIDKLNCKFIKIKGHKASNQKNKIDEIFTLVDKASRNALRKNEI